MRNLFERKISAPEQLDEFVKELMTHFKTRTVVLLEGEVGSGKTETVKALSRVKGWREVASPSFALHHRYGTDDDGADHLDLYRLESEDDLESTGFWDLFSEEKGLILIEWADRLNPSYLPLNWTRIRIKYARGPGVTDRTLTVEEF